jgi:predicted RNase H-like nuclease (RuvC/YqgF family)
MTDHLGDANTKAGATPEDSSAVRQKGDAMSEIKRFDIPRNGNEFLHEDPDGEYVQYDDHRAEVERLTAERHRLQGDVEALAAERDEAQAEVEQLWRDLTAADGTIDGLRAESTELAAERDAARAEVERLPARLEHAETRIVPPLPHADESAQLVHGKMDAYVTSLTAELHETRERLARVQVQYDEFARVTAKTIDQHQRERDEARQQVYRLQQACGQNGASGQGMLDTSRPSDEDIWREGFMRCLNDVAAEDWQAQADLVLTTYRKRWPR